MDIDLSAMAGEHVRENFSARTPRLLQHYRTPVEKKVGETERRSTVGVNRADWERTHAEMKIYMYIQRR